MPNRDLSDANWSILEPLLPPQKPKRGRPNSDHRRIINGILWILRTGAPWRDLPRRYGPVGTVSSRFYRWRASGVWDRVLAALAGRGGRARRGRLGPALCGCHHRSRPSARRRRSPGRRRRGVRRRPGGAGPQPGRLLDQAAPAGRRQWPADHGGADRRRAARADRAWRRCWTRARSAAPGGAAPPAAAARGRRQGLQQPNRAAPPAAASHPRSSRARATSAASPTSTARPIGGATGSSA